MISLTFLKILSTAGVMATVSIPTGAFLYDSLSNPINNFLKDGTISSEKLKEYCYLLLSADEINKKDLVVCEVSKNLNYYIVDRTGEKATISEIEQVVSSSPGSYIGGDVIVSLKRDTKNLALSGIKNKNTVLTVLHSLGRGGLKSKCKKIDRQETNTLKLNCDGKRSIDLTQYEIKNHIT